MTDQTDTDNEPAGHREPDEAEMGAPIDLRPLVEEAPADHRIFIDRLRRSVHRRLLGGSIIEFCVLGPAVVLLEALVAIAAVFTPAKEKDP